MRLLFTFVFLCQTLFVFAQSLIVGVASTIQLQPKQTTIVKSDYFPSGTAIQKVEWPQGLSLLSENTGSYIVAGKFSLPLANIRFHRAKGAVDIPCRNIRKLAITAQIELAKPASDVRIKGSFNAWVADSTLLKPIGNIPTQKWILSNVEANEGYQQYKLVVNGKEENPVNATIVSNGMGGTNAQLKFGEPDAIAVCFAVLCRVRCARQCHSRVACRSVCVACCALWSGHNCFLLMIASQPTPVSGTQSLHRCALHRRLLLCACCIGARCIVASAKPPCDACCFALVACCIRARCIVASATPFRSTPPCDALCAERALLDWAKGGLCGGAMRRVGDF
jgi:hypothetical protein